MQKANIFCTGNDQLIACILCTHQKLYKFDEVVMIIFVSGKNRPLILAKGVHWCFHIHVYSAFMAWNLGYLAKKVHDIPPTLTIFFFFFGLTWFLCIRYIHTNVCWSFFHFGNTILEKNYQAWNLTHPSPCYELPIMSICDCDWLIDEIWFFLSAECRHALNYGHTGLIHCIDDRPTIVYCLDCVKLLQYPCIFHSIL